MALQQTHDYGLLEPAQEDALHAARLLQVEERPFQRVTRNLLSKDSLLKAPVRQLPSPPPDGVEATVDTLEHEAAKRRKFKEDIMLDFAALESSIVRIQLLQSSNARERERYAAAKAKILSTAQAVKSNTVELRAQLTEARKVLQQRKGYDELAAKLIDAERLKPRDETRQDIEKLEKAIEDLRQENADIDGMWVGRREAFDRLVKEGESAMRVIRGIKEGLDTEKDEQPEDGDEAGKGGESSGMVTPTPGGSTPAPADVGDQTPLQEGIEGNDGTTTRSASRFLEVSDATRVGSRVVSPSLAPTDLQVDVAMEEGDVLDPQTKVEGEIEPMDES